MLMTRIFLEEKKFSSGVLQIFVQHLEERGIIIMASFQRAFNTTLMSSQSHCVRSISEKKSSP